MNDSLNIIGISVRTANDGRAIEDLGKLWNRFFQENIISKIPNQVNQNIYSIYTDYESDYNGEYTTIIGLEVSNLDEVPKGMVAREFAPQNFKKYIAKGEMPQAVGETWKKIWEDDENLNRTYLYDYELYTEKSQNPSDAEVDIYIGIED